MRLKGSIIVIFISIITFNENVLRIYGLVGMNDHSIQYNENFLKNITTPLNHELVSFHPIYSKSKKKNEYFIGARNAIFLLNEDTWTLDIIWNGTDIANDRRELNGSSVGMTLPLKSKWYKETWHNFTFVYDDCLYSRINYTKIRNDDTGAFGNIRRRNHIFDEKLINFTCFSIFIKHVALIENEDSEYLWACGTFGGYPRAFKLNSTTFEFLGYTDRNVFSCARDIDEPMSFYYSETRKDFYIGTSHGFYRPDKKKPDVPYNNSTVLYSDWRPFLNNFQFLTDLAIFFGSDVNFVPKMYETPKFIYAFGFELNRDYGYINKMNRDSWMSFMIRICKNDTGWNYTGLSMKDVRWHIHNNTYDIYRIDKTGEYPRTPTHQDLGYNPQWWGDSAHLPTRHFIYTVKFNFGCYLQRFYQSQAFNYFRGASNSVYMNRLVDALFDPNGPRVRHPHCGNEYHIMDALPMVAAFNGPGLNQFSSGTGAICLFKVNDFLIGNVTLRKKAVLPTENIYYPSNADHFLSYGLESFDLFTSYKQDLRGNYVRRKLGGALEGFEDLTPPLYTKTAYGPRDYSWIDETLQYTINHDYFVPRLWLGSCQKSHRKHRQMDDYWFEKYVNLSSFTWPLEFDQRSSAPYLQGCDPNLMHLYGDNAVFVLEGVQFKRMLLVEKGITNYEYYGRHYVEKLKPALMYVILVSTKGVLYRVVMCDITTDQEPFVRNEELKLENRFDRTQLYCHFNYSHQPKIRIYQTNPMKENDEKTWAKYFVKSALISETDLVLPPNKIDEYGDVVKDASIQEDSIFITHFDGIVTVPLKNCASYTQCKDCASDPYCMWSVNSNESESICVPYSNTTSDSIKTVQDVLSRGWKCVDHVKADVERVFTDNIDEGIYLKCRYCGYYRGKIHWERNGKKINFRTKKSRSLYNLDTELQILTLLQNSLVDRENFTCVGTNENTNARTILARFQFDSYLNFNCDSFRKLFATYEEIDDLVKTFYMGKCSIENLAKILCYSEHIILLYLILYLYIVHFT